ncbi:phage protein Gp37 [Methylophaga nitratireducenticrescens]|uniref:phage protein Gp37 n=1 Tax=Methylophaga nitratireducenticrescens TaxID=754476 RepID=UPI000CDBDD7B|nr:phage protein Gp37 [Methylophaga nitratireducenticrescens]AUZ85849.1 hypothetical protein CDW43_15310 [Methylophaga nitratireducenticrescens]
MSIAIIEDHIVNTTKSIFKDTLRKVETLPNALNLALLKQLIPSAPSVYCAFLGGSSSGSGMLNARFDVYVITRHAGDDEARRRGGSTTIGAYQVIESLIPKLHGSDINAIGNLNLKSVKNLFSVQLEENFKAAMYAMTFEVPNMPFPNQHDLSDLSDFVTYHAEHSMTEGNNEPDAIDYLTLDQGTE